MQGHTGDPVKLLGIGRETTWSASLAWPLFAVKSLSC